LNLSFFAGAQARSLRMRLVRGALGIGGLQLLFLPLQFAASILLARVLGPEGFGQYTFIMSVIMVLSLPFDMGIRQFVTREVAGYLHEGQWSLFRGLLRRLHQWVLLGVLLIAWVLGGLAVWRTTWVVSDRWTLLLVGLGILPFLGLNALREAALRGLGFVVRAQIPNLLVRPGFHLAAAALLLAAGLLNPATALLSQAAAVALAFAIGAVLLRRHRPAEVGTTEPDYHNAQWAGAWLSFTLLMAASLLNNRIGILLLGWIGTDEQVAGFRLADQGAQLVAMSLIMINLVIGPHITRIYRAGSTNRLQQLSRQSARAALALSLPIALPLIFFGSPLITFVFGAEYVGITIVPLAVLAGAQLVNVGFGSVGMFLAMSGFERDAIIGHLIALTLNISTGLFLIPKFGASGAASAAAVGLIAWNLVLGFKFRQRLNLRPSAL